MDPNESGLQQRLTSPQTSIWIKMIFTTTAVLSVLMFGQTAFAIGTPIGYAKGTTGGGSLTPVEPSSLAELETWLGDSTARVILLTKIYDYTSYKGTVSGDICKPWTCASGSTGAVQYAINANNWCSTALSTGSWYAAGTQAMKVGSNKTLLGKGSNAGLKGRGIKIVDATNVIVQNIKITDINHQYVWGGDAIDISNSDNVWIDHNYIARTGRQQLAIHFGDGTVNRMTITNNYFDGTATYSTGCNGYHYWMFLVNGVNDKITFAKNYVYHSAGRGPSVGGTAGYSQNIHMFNNYFLSINGHALNAATSAHILAEGNAYSGVTTPVTTDTTGAAYVPVSASYAPGCATYIGRNCVINTASSSGAINRNDIGTLPYFSGDTAYLPVPAAASGVASSVLANAGVGKVN